MFKGWGLEGVPCTKTLAIQFYLLRVGLLLQLMFQLFIHLTCYARLSEAFSNKIELLF